MRHLHVVGLGRVIGLRSTVAQVGTLLAEEGFKLGVTGNLWIDRFRTGVEMRGQTLDLLGIEDGLSLQKPAFDLDALPLTGVLVEALLVLAEAFA